MTGATGRDAVRGRRGGVPPGRGAADEHRGLLRRRLHRLARRARRLTGPAVPAGRRRPVPRQAGRAALARRGRPGRRRRERRPRRSRPPPAPRPDSAPASRRPSSPASPCSTRCRRGRPDPARGGRRARADLLDAGGWWVSRRRAAVRRRWSRSASSVQRIGDAPDERRGAGQDRRRLRPAGLPGHPARDRRDGRAPSPSRPACRATTRPRRRRWSPRATSRSSGPAPRPVGRLAGRGLRRPDQPADGRLRAGAARARRGGRRGCDRPAEARRTGCSCRRGCPGPRRARRRRTLGSPRVPSPRTRGEACRPVQSQEHNPLPEHPPVTRAARRGWSRAAPTKYHEANAGKGKLFARERVRLLVDEGSFVEDGAVRQRRSPTDLPADGVVTGTATVDGRPVCADGQRLDGQGRLVGRPDRREDHPDHRDAPTATGVPMVYLVDSAGARITDQVDLFPGRRGAGKIFWNQVRASGSIPQVCALFGPSAAGGAYIPAFCDVVVMVEGNASMYLGSDRMVEMVTGEKTTLEEMGGARVHCAESGVGHFLVETEQEALDAVRALPVLPAVELAGRRRPPAEPGAAPANVDLARAGAGERAAGLRHAPLRQGPARRGVVLRDPRAVGPRGHGRLRPARRRGRRRRRQQLDVQGRRALRRLRRQGDPLRAAVRRVQRAAAVPLRRARLHGRHGRREGRASSGTARR